MKELNVLMPIAGLGSRFAKAGYDVPKPLISVFGKPMIQLVIENINIKGNYIYIVQKDHYEKYNLECLLNKITPNCKIVCINRITEGAACTTLFAKDYINNNNPLLIANSDQYIEWDSVEFIKYLNKNSNGSILTFNCSNDPKLSYVRLDENKNVIEIKEKQPISSKATVGIYYWAQGSEYVKYAESMIRQNKRTNGEFYVAPVYQEALDDNKTIKIYDVEKMWGLGTPECLDYFIKNYKQSSFSL